MTGRQPACKWSYQTKGRIGRSSPAVARNGTVYVGDQECLLYAISNEGRLVWRRRTTGRASGATASITNDSAIDGCLYAVSPEMDVAWQFHTGAIIHQCSPAIAGDGTIYFGSWDHCLYALSSDGRLKWKFSTERPISSSPAVAADGTIYFGSQDRRYYALHPDSSLKWELRTDGPVMSSPAITDEGDVVVCTHNRSILALDEQNGGPAMSCWPMLLGGARRNGQCFRCCRATVVEGAGVKSVRNGFIAGPSLEAPGGS